MYKKRDRVKKLPLFQKNVPEIWQIYFFIILFCDRSKKPSKIAAYSYLCKSLPIIIWAMCLSDGQNMVVTSYPIIYLDFAANFFSNIGNHSSLCIYKELLMMGSLSLIKELQISVKIQLLSKYQKTNTTFESQIRRNSRALALNQSRIIWFIN